MGITAWCTSSPLPVKEGLVWTTGPELQTPPIRHPELEWACYQCVLCHNSPWPAPYLRWRIWVTDLGPADSAALLASFPRLAPPLPPPLRIFHCSLCGTAL